MAEEFEFRDLRDAVFWGVDLRGATFRDVDLQGARISHARVVDVAIDAVVDRLVVNGVDVTAYVAANDEWSVLRSHLFPTEPERMRQGWPRFVEAWEGAVERARGLPDGQRHASVAGEWSFVQTLRHLVFATDKWCTVPVLGASFHPMGLPNSGSADFGWPGLNTAADPSFDDAVAAWRERGERVGALLDGIDAAALSTEVEVLENGTSAVHDCIGVVFEEHFQHLRYALRDLDHLHGGTG